MNKFALLALGAVMITGCGKISGLMDGVGGPQIVGSGKSTTIKRSVGKFDKIELMGSMDADVSVGEAKDLEITGDDNIAPLVKTEIEGGTLKVYLEGSYSTKTRLTLQVSTASLTGVTLSGSGNTTLRSCKDTSMDLDIRGSGSVQADGFVDNLNASIKGSGDLNLYGLKAKDAKVEIFGSGSADITVTGALAGNIAGSGSITYAGKPSKVSRSVAGSGEISAKN